MGSNREQEITENMEQLSGAAYQTIAQSLTDSFLQEADQEAHDKAQETHQASERNVLETGRMLNMGNIQESQVSMNGAFNNAANKRGETAQKEQKNKRDGDAMFRALLAQIRDNIAQMENELATMETKLKLLYGDNYLVDAATDILGEIPEREAGESESEYNDRLKDRFADKMLDDDGNLKDEFKNHPDKRIRQIAQSIKTDADIKKAHDIVNEITDPSKSMEEKVIAVEPLKKSENLQIANATAALIDQTKEESKLVANAADVGFDDKFDKEVEVAQVSFLDNGWPS